MKGAKRYMEIMLMAFHLIFSFAHLEQMGHFGPENDASS